MCKKLEILQISLSEKGTAALQDGRNYVLSVAKREVIKSETPRQNLEHKTNVDP